MWRDGNTRVTCACSATHNLFLICRLIMKRDLLQVRVNLTQHTYKSLHFSGSNPWQLSDLWWREKGQLLQWVSSCALLYPSLTPFFPELQTGLSLLLKAAILPPPCTTTPDHYGSLNSFPSPSLVALIRGQRDKWFMWQSEPVWLPSIHKSAVRVKCINPVPCCVLQSKTVF